MQRRCAVWCVSIALVGIMIMPGVCLANHTGQKWAATESWTYAVYVSGDNSLERFWDDSSLPLLLNLPANDMFHIVAIMDRLSTDGTEVIEISGSTWEVVANYPEMDFGDGATFEWFLEEVSYRYPSDKLAVTAWDHGYAWRYISDDTTSGSRISMPELQRAIENAGVYIDVLAFDACNMAAVEVAYQLSLTGLVGIMVGSEESVPTTGFPYDLMLMPTALDTTRTPAQMAVDMVQGFEAYYAPQTWATTVALSAVNISAISESSSVFYEWVDAMRSYLPVYETNYKQALNDAYCAWATHYHVDMADLGDALLADSLVTDTDFRGATSEMVSAIDGSILDAWGGKYAEDSRGLTLWWGWGGDWNYYADAYTEVAFATDTGWWSFLDEYN